MKKNSHKKPLINLSLNGWLILGSVFIVCGAVSLYALTDFVCHKVIKNSYSYGYHPIAAIGMFFPMSVLMGIISYKFSKSLYQYTLELTDAITKISDGEFQVKLDEANGGPFQDIYHKFNMMVDELASIDTMRNDFVNEFSHEFKTPLTAINGFSQLLLEGNCTPEQSKQYLSIIAKESERLTALTESQLLLSRLDSQQIVIEKEHYSLDEQIRQCIILLSSEWSKKELDFSIELESIPYYGNADLLHHVWMNLISNAIKYTPKGGEISVSSKLTPTEICICISDTGSGMTEDELAHIFGKYYRASSSSGIKGLGLGLPIVKRVVEMNHGTIEVKSEVGTGSTFTVILPRSS